MAQIKRMLAYQTVKPDKVYVVDDPPKDPTQYDTDVRTRAGLQAAIADGMDLVFTWDDDEYYAPTYLEWMLDNWPNEADVIGCHDIPYYHLAYRRVTYRDYRMWATNGCTAMRPKAAVNFAYKQTGYMFDRPLWEWFRANLRVKLFPQIPVPFQVVGIKHGIGSLTAGAHDWPAKLFNVDDAAGDWLRANVDRRVVDFYLHGDWKHG